MRDYAEQVKALRYCGDCDRQGCAKECKYGKEHPLNFRCIGFLLADAADAIEELLAAVPKQGEWLPRPNPQFIEVDVCSVCGIGTRKMYHCTDGIQTWDEKPFFRYCPWCGAKLQEPPKGVE